jgi:hypothetical protein
MNTPDNAIYYHLAYTAAAVIYVGYAITLFVRRRNLMARYNAMNAGGKQS